MGRLGFARKVVVSASLDVLHIVRSDKVTERSRSDRSKSRSDHSKNRSDLNSFLLGIRQIK
jgi:hypothetical protein